MMGRDPIITSKISEVMDEYETGAGMSLTSSGSSCACCCCRPESLNRVVNGTRFCCVACFGLINAASPWALATAEAVTMVLLYALTIPGKQRREPYSLGQSCEDILVISLLRSGLALICHFWGTGSLYQRPYMYCVMFFGCISLPLSLFKIAALEQGPIKPAKHPAFLVFYIMHACFALAHMIAAGQVSTWARRRYELGLTGLGYPWEEGEQTWLLAGDLSGSWIDRGYHTNSRSTMMMEPLLQLEDATGLLQSSDSLFMTDCLGVTVHYRLVNPPGTPRTTTSTVIVLVHGWGGGVFAWRHVMRALAEATGCSVLAFDRPGFGLTSRPPPPAPHGPRGNRTNPYAQRFQARMAMLLCERLHVVNAVLVGHSDGALLCLRMAALSAVAAAAEQHHGAELQHEPDPQQSSSQSTGSAPITDWVGSAPESQELLARLLRGEVDPGLHWPPFIPEPKSFEEATGTLTRVDKGTAILQQSNGDEESQSQQEQASRRIEQTSPVDREIRGDSPPPPPLVPPPFTHHHMPVLKLNPAKRPLSPFDRMRSPPDGGEGLQKEPGQSMPSQQQSDAAVGPSARVGLAAALSPPAAQTITPLATPETGSSPPMERRSSLLPAGPPRVRGVFLLAPDLRGSSCPLYAHALARSRLGRAVLARQLRAEAGHVANPRAWADPRSHLSREIVELYRAPFRLHSWDAALVATCRVPVDVHTADRVRLCSTASASGAVCLATGEADAFVSPAALRATARKLFPPDRQPRCIDLPACGHLPHEEAPVALTRILAAFVASLGPNP